MFHKYSWMLMLAVLTGLVFLSGCSSEESTAGPEPTELKKPQRMMIETQTLKSHDLTENFTLPGAVEAWEDLLLAAEVAGPIRWIGLEEGARLKTNQAILRIDTDTVKANLQRDQTAFDLQQQEHSRYQQLLAEQLVSQQEYDRVKNSLEVARANLRQAELALKKSTCSSPIDGVLDRLLVDRGEYVKSGDPLARVVQIDKLKVLVDLPEKDVTFLHSGQKVKVFAANLVESGDAGWDGEILHVGYQADQSSRTYRVKVVMDNPAGALRPGMILRVRFERRQHTSAMAIPLYALIDQEGKKVVFVEKNGEAEKRSVEIGAVIGQQILITAGLSDGEKLIVKGHQLLTDGALVTAKEQ